MYSDRYEPSWRKFTFPNFCKPLLQSFVIFGCKHLSACCRRGNSLCSMNVGILCENCIMIIFATSENTTSRWMLPRLYEIRCIRNCFYNTSKQLKKKNKSKIDRVPVSVSEWLLGFFVLILILSNSTNIHKYWDSNAV